MAYGPTAEQVAEEREATERAARMLLRAAGFFAWGHDAWCHDEHGYGCVTTAEALDLLHHDEVLLGRLLGPIARRDVH